MVVVVVASSSAILDPVLGVFDEIQRWVSPELLIMLLGHFALSNLVFSEAVECGFIARGRTF